MLEAMRAARFAILIFGRGRTRSTRRRRTAWLGRRDSNICISKSNLQDNIPPQRVFGVDRARL